MLNNNDWHYILRRLVIFILISIAMFLIGIFKAKAFTFDLSVTPIKTQKVFESNISNSVGLSNSGYTSSINYFSRNKTITCDTDKCGIEFYYNATLFRGATYSGGTAAESMQIVAVGAQLGTNDYPSCTVNGNTISCVVDNNKTWDFIQLQFTKNAEFSANGQTATTSVKYSINDIINVYNINDSLTTAIQQNTQAVQETNNTIKDSNVDTNSASSSFSDLENQMASNGTISSLLTMPITLLQKLLNGLSGNCSAYPIGEIFGYNMSIECIQPTQYIGTALWNIIDVVCAGFIAYKLGKRFVVIFNDITNLKDGGLDSAYD